MVIDRYVYWSNDSLNKICMKIQIVRILIERCRIVFRVSYSSRACESCLRVGLHVSEFVLDGSGC